MAQGKKTYPAEFKRRMVELVRAGSSAPPTFRMRRFFGWVSAPPNSQAVM